MAGPRHLAGRARATVRATLGTDPVIFHLIHAVKNELLGKLDALSAELRSVSTARSEESAILGMQLTRLSHLLEQRTDLGSDSDGRSLVEAALAETRAVRSELAEVRSMVPLLAMKSARRSLLDASVAGVSGEQRVRMTLGCRDSDGIPKVEGAGSSEVVDGTPVQVMHNGLRVVKGGYYGDWEADVIEGLRGHHEPQEELVFHSVLERIDHPAPVMLELGCFWAYYSLWFLRRLPHGTAIAVEPDPDHLQIGRQNAALNGLSPVFLGYASGVRSGEFALPSELHPGVVHQVSARSVPQILEEAGADRLDVLHLDIQGYEAAVLDEAQDLIDRGRIRFVFVSTHHHYISGSGDTHQRCLDWLAKHGASIVAEHTVAESYSGDGLIVASFDSRDRDYRVEISYNRPTNSLFGPPELDLERVLTIVDRAADESEPDG